MESVTLSASLRPAVRMRGVLRPAAIPAMPPDYAGAYAVTPSAAAQTLPTAGHILYADVAVAAIPYAESPNAGGGLTAVIGGA